LIDPAQEGFIARGRMMREAHGVRYQASEYLYSHHQLLAVSILRPLMPFVTVEGPEGRASRLDPRIWWDLLVRPRLALLRSLTVPLSALDPLYYPDIVGKFLGDISEWEEYLDWKESLRSTTLMRWLGVEPGWFKDHALGLLRIADGIDPLGGWHRLVREASRESWEELRGDARSAVDLRIAAELLLSYYDRLAKARQARALPRPTGRKHTEFDTRFKPRGHVERVLTDFGLSPQPRLVLVVEGVTEMLIFPRLLKHFGIRTDREFIAIEDREGVTKDISALLAYAIAPPTQVEEKGRYLRPLRPLTRLLVMTDPEGPMATPEQRQKRRTAWLNRLVRTFPPRHRTAAVRGALERLIHVETWDEHGQAFEFAHFTDRQLATVIASLGKRERQPSLRDRTEHIRRLRVDRANIEKALEPKATKRELAQALWPVLLAKIKRAQRTDTAGRIPIVRVLDEATRLANEFPPSGVVIALKRQT
jgi:hypothetical protein